MLLNGILKQSINVCRNVQVCKAANALRKSDCIALMSGLEAEVSRQLGVPQVTVPVIYQHTS